VQQLQEETHLVRSGRGCAGEILEAVPAVMRFIRTQMRRHRRSDLSVPQFRALLFLSRNPGASLSLLAEFLALSLPATSRLVDGLVRKGLVVRRIPTRNRRLVALSTSGRGQTTVRAARQATERQLADVLAALSRGERAAIQRALRALRKQFQSVAGRTAS
jgi:DNA-binding MarR family transcriptional regulator